MYDQEEIITTTQYEALYFIKEILFSVTLLYIIIQYLVTYIMFKYIFTWYLYIQTYTQNLPTSRIYEMKHTFNNYSCVYF